MQITEPVVNGGAKLYHCNRKPVQVSLSSTHQDFRHAFDSDAAVFPPVAISIQPTTAEILATVREKTSPICPNIFRASLLPSMAKRLR